MTNNPIFISIIVPVYKVEQYLPKCIESILAQTYQNWELLLIDDGSPDNSGNICDEYALKDSRIKVFHKVNGGVSSARNLGLEKSCGEWIWFVDSDDTIETNALHNINKHIKKADGSELCFYFGMNKIQHFKTTVLSHARKRIFVSDFILRLLSYQVVTGPVLYIYKKNCIKSIKFDTTLRIGEDLCFHYLVMNANENMIIAQEPEIIYNYVINPNSVMQSVDLSFVEKYNDLSNYIYTYIYKLTDNTNIRCYALTNIYKNFIEISKRLYNTYSKDKNKYLNYVKNINNEFIQYPSSTSAEKNLTKQEQVILKLLKYEHLLWLYLKYINIKSKFYHNIKKFYTRIKLL